MEQRQFILSQNDIPTEWYNIAADLDEPPPPPLHPATQQPCGPEDLAPIFPMHVLEQEMSTQRWIKIPEEVLEVLAQWRPSPLVQGYRARESSEDSGEDILQIRRRQPRGKSQTQYRDRSGLLQ